jgi:hypothetical protein
VMFNLTVGEAHTFFVGDGQWLVHSTECLVRPDSLRNYYIVPKDSNNPSNA